MYKIFVKAEPKLHLYTHRQYRIKAYSCKFKTEQWKFYSAIHEDTKHLCNILALMSVCIMDDSNSD